MLGLELELGLEEATTAVGMMIAATHDGDAHIVATVIDVCVGVTATPNPNPNSNPSIHFPVLRNNILD